MTRSPWTAERAALEGLAFVLIDTPNKLFLQYSIDVAAVVRGAARRVVRAETIP